MMRKPPILLMKDRRREMTPIDKIKLENGVFSFSVVGNGPSGEEITMLLKMNVDGEAMEGTLEIEEMGMNGTWEATKQK